MEELKALSAVTSVTILRVPPRNVAAGKIDSYYCTYPNAAGAGGWELKVDTADNTDHCNSPSLITPMTADPDGPGSYAMTDGVVSYAVCYTPTSYVSLEYSRYPAAGPSPVTWQQLKDLLLPEAAKAPNIYTAALDEAARLYANR